MGRFLLGSTIVMLFKKEAVIFNEEWTPERRVRLGELMGNRLGSGPIKMVAR
jgi:phosphatidylserine decarboxylase